MRKRLPHTLVMIVATLILSTTGSANPPGSIGGPNNYQQRDLPVVVIGDSIARGTSALRPFFTAPYGWPDMLEDSSQFEVYNLSVGGASTRFWTTFPIIIPEDLGPFVAVISLGYNDATLGLPAAGEFFNNLVIITDRLRDLGAERFVFTQHNPYTGFHDNTGTIRKFQYLTVQQALCNVIKDWDCIWMGDMPIARYHIWVSSSATRRGGWNPHPTRDGQEWLAFRIFGRLVSIVFGHPDNT